jgi:hypothetical protein
MPFNGYLFHLLIFYMIPVLFCMVMCLSLKKMLNVLHVSPEQFGPVKRRI